jgi:hypothetical protein
MYIINDTNSLLNTNFANTLLRNSKAEVKEFEKAKYFLHIIHTNLDITTVCKYQKYRYAKTGVHRL